MAELFNIYCDESCHLEHDASQFMVLGAVWCPAAKSHAISARIREIKTQYGLSSSLEIKWTKVSPAKQGFYLAIVDYFFDNDDLHFRGVLIPDKSKLDHIAFGQSHDDWYYQMCFTLLEPVIDPEQSYCVYLDIKDTRSEDKRARLERVLRSRRADHIEAIIKKVQQIRSHESELLQLTDLLIGAIGYSNRGVTTGSAKLALVERIRRRSKKRLDTSTWLRESKFNLFRWTPHGGTP
jgi:hypothetical protein